LLRLLSSHLAIIVLTLNKFFVAISLSFTGSPIHPPPSRCSQAALPVLIHPQLPQWLRLHRHLRLPPSSTYMTRRRVSRHVVFDKTNFPCSSPPSSSTTELDFLLEPWPPITNGSASIVHSATAQPEGGA
jgi:hypothetical protein